MYKLYKTFDGQNAAYFVDDLGATTSFLFDPDNTDYQAYLKWLEEGNTPEPASDSVDE
jgi:hypothetical protein